MFENSPAGISLLSAEVPVTVTGEDRHQDVLARYSVPAGGQRSVAVELAWCTIGAGKHRGQRAIEVRLDGYRVGELTYLMSQRYADLVRQVAATGGRPGCEAVVERDARGLQITLRLPKDTEQVVPLASSASAPRTGVNRPATWIVAGAAVFVILLFAGVFGGGDEPDQVSSPATETTTSSYEPPPTTTTTAPTTTTTTTTITTTTTVPAPPPQTEEPVAPPVVEEPPQQSGCDPNYSGCVPIAPDVDCAGGSGNGPAYTSGPVQVIGSDIYDLDRDSDGVACE